MRSRSAITAISAALVLAACQQRDLFFDTVFLVITPAPTTVQKGQTVQLSAHLKSSYRADEQVVPIWSSSNNRVITINSSGLVTAADTGFAWVKGITITARDSIKISVTP